MTLAGHAAVAAAMGSVLACGRVPGRAGRALRGVLGGVWLGWLGEGALRALDDRYYTRDAMYRSTDWNEGGLLDWEQACVASAFAPGSRIVIPGCGGGREVLALRREGYEAVGYEAHGDLEAFGAGLLSAHGYPGTVRPVPRDRFPAGEHADGVLLGWGLYSLVWPRAVRVALLEDARRAVAPGGSVIVSAFARPRVDREMRLTAALAGWIRRLRGASPIELGDALAPNRVHVFTPERLAGELADAGLELASCVVAAAADAATGYLCAVGRRMA